MGREIKPINGPLDAKRGVRPEGLSIEMYGERNIDGWVPRSRSVWPYSTFRYGNFHVLCACMFYVLANICAQVMCYIHVVKIKNLSSCNTVLRDSYDLPACLLDHGSMVEKFISSNAEKTVASWSRQQEQKKGRGKKEISSSKVSLLSQEEGMFLCHCFPFSWQREQSQGRACQCESSLKVWRLQLDIASGLTPKEKDNTHPSVKMCQTTHSANT